MGHHSAVRDLSGVSKHSNATGGDDANTNKHGTKTVGCSPTASADEESQPSSTQDTLSSISQVFGTHKDSDSTSGAEEDVPPKWKKWAPKTPKEDNPPKESSNSSSDDEQLTDKALHTKVRQKMQLLDT